MLQTIQAKAEATAQTHATKEKETPSEELAGGLNTFFAQFMAAMPAQAATAGVTPAAASGEDARAAIANRNALNRTEARALRQDSDDDAAADARRADQAQAADPRRAAPDQTGQTAQAARAARAKAAQTTPTTDPAPQAAPDQAQPQAAPATGATPTASPAADQTQAAPAQTAAATTLAAPADAAAAGSPATAATAAPVAAAPKPQAPDTIPAAKAQAALEQANPGLRVQFQFGDPAAQPTSKPALSEFMNQIKVELQSPSFAGVGSGSGESAATATPQLLPTLQLPVPTEQQATLLALGQPVKEGAPAAASLQSTLTPSEVVGAGAALGATGSVRVTPTTQAAPAAPLQRETPMSQVDSTIKWLIKNKDQSAELQLHPESLGRVQIKLKVEGTEVHAKLWASEASAMPILQEHRAFLEASLKAQGLTLGSFDLQHGRQSDQAPLPNPDSAPAPLIAAAPLAATGQEAPALLTPGPAGAHRIEIVA
jgi:flagellar hook-length control protein FliK